MVYVKIWESGQFGKLSNEAKLLFIGMITLADDDGKLRADPAYLRAQIFPYNESMSVTEALRFRNEIEKNGLITVYSIDGFEYIEHPKWKEYQSIRSDLYKKSTLPLRNNDVTEPLRKRPCKLSKVKLSKDKLVTTSDTGVADKINPLIALFEPINPSFKRLYANVTQRKSLSRLLEAHGEYKLKQIIALLPESNASQYAPTITTPLALEDKLGALIVFLKKHQQKQSVNKIAKI